MRFTRKLTGRNSRPGEWSTERHAFAQKIVHVEDACKSVLEAIRALDEDLRREFKFLGTLEGYD
jgi:hypothetical protein